MSFEAFSQAPIADLIAAAGGDNKVSLLVGAGASMEASLPSWDALLDRLLIRGAETSGLLKPLSAKPDVEESKRRKQWLTDASRDGPLGKAALVEALAGAQLDNWAKTALYEPARGPADYFPGPISRQIPVLSDAIGPDLRVMTLNYDDLIEQAFRQHRGAPEPYAISDEDHHVPAGQVRRFPICTGTSGETKDRPGRSFSPRPTTCRCSAAPPGKRSS